MRITEKMECIPKGVHSVVCFYLQANTALINSQTLATEEMEARSLMVWISFKSGPIEMQSSPGIFSERIPHSKPA